MLKSKACPERSRRAKKFTVLASISAAVFLIVLFNGTKSNSSSSKAAPSSKYLLQITAPVTMAKCSRCHDNLDAWKNLGLIFNHPVHLERGFACKACHFDFPHRPDGSVVKPPMDVCYDCHSLRHSEKGLVAGEECGLCHPPGFNLKPANHTPEFVGQTHPERATSDVKYCVMCHKREFCQRCHLRRGIEPTNHQEQQMWRGKHGKQEEGVEGCSVCHAQPFCDDCHKTQIPHAETWVEQHSDSSPEAMANCSACHRQDDYCSDCHHAGVANNLLIQENCVRCHPEYLKSLFDIKKKSYSVHKAHFDLTQTKPYECKVCHSKEYTKGVGCFSFDLCKMCHGKLRLGKPIAKWNVDTGELCARCHQGEPGKTPTRSPF